MVGYKGVLGTMGRTVITRGMPRTQHLARARIVFSVAKERCRQIFAPSGCITLWQLPAETERAFSDHWSIWLKQQWVLDFVESIKEPDLGGIITQMDRLDMIDESQISKVNQLRRSSDSPGVQLPGFRELNNETLCLLAAGFSLGSKEGLVIPYARLDSSGY